MRLRHGASHGVCFSSHNKGMSPLDRRLGTGTTDSTALTRWVVASLGQRFGMDAIVVRRSRNEQNRRISYPP